MYALIIIEESIEQNYNDTGKINHFLEEGGIERIFYNNFLINLTIASLAFAELQIMAKQKNFKYKVIYFEKMPEPFYFEGLTSARP
ncbi:MAG: hypothetical protein RSD40_06390 [Bacilli bacterium]